MTEQPAGLGPAVRTPAGDAPVIPLFLLAAGMYLAWFGVHYWRSDVKYPTDPVKAILQGKGLPAATRTPTADEQAVITAARNLAGQTAATQQPVGGSAQQAKTIASGGGAAANQQIGKLLAASYGWASGAQWQALVDLWNRESGWDNRIWNGGSHADTQPNGSSGAYGIPQALPYSKMPKAAWPPGYGGTADPTSQISWGLAYIKAAYGDPVTANNFDATHPGY
jgi:hypothetical protein